MKRLAVLIASVLIIPLSFGCHTTPNTSQPPAALAPGYNNPTDKQIGEALASARAFYTRIQQDVAKGTYTPSDTEKAALNSFGITLNTANAAYLTYHANPTAANEATALKDSQQVQAQQTALQPTIPGVSLLGPVKGHLDIANNASDGNDRITEAR